MDQFTVPQFIDAEDQIFGPVTARQFVILMIVFLVCFLFFKIFSFLIFLLTAVPLFACGIVLAFVRINGQPFHFFILNGVQTFKKPRLRVWDKTLTDQELKYYMSIVAELPKEKFRRKSRINSDRLEELSLVVNTGGVYKPE